MDESCFSCGKNAEIWFQGYPLCYKCYEQAQKKGFKDLSRVVEEKPVIKAQAKSEPSLEMEEINPEDSVFVVGVLAVILVVIIALVLLML
ncbi:MAG: hypothetical protein ACOC5L_04390 [Halobacteriota archaeon]